MRLTEELRAAGVAVRYGPNPGGRRWLARATKKLGGQDPAKLLGRRGLLVVESVLRWLAIARSLLAARLGGRIAVMDRYTVCQQVSVRVHGGGRFLQRAVKLAYSAFPAPEILILLDITPEAAFERIERRGTDHEELSFLRAAAEAYRDMGVDAVRIDGGMPEDEVAQAIWKTVLTRTTVATG